MSKDFYVLAFRSWSSMVRWASLLTRLLVISEFCTHGIVSHRLFSSIGRVPSRYSAFGRPSLSLGCVVLRLVGMSYGVVHCGGGGAGGGGGCNCISSVSIKSSSSIIPQSFITLAKSNFPVLVVSEGSCDVWFDCACVIVVAWLTIGGLLLGFQIEGFF